MQHLWLSWLSVVIYLVAEIFYSLDLVERRPALGKAASRMVMFGLAVHFLGLLARSRAFGAVPYNDLYGSLSLFAWMIGIIYLALEIRHRQKSVGAFLLPFLIVLQLLAAWMNKSVLSTRPELASGLKGSLFAYHVTGNILAYSAFTVSFILSTLYLLQHRQIRQRRPGALFSRLPSLELLERMNRTAVWIGVPALLIGISTGVAWANQVFGTLWRGDAKLVWSLITLLIYVSYLFFDRLGAWQGRRSAIVSVCGFLVMAFSYSAVNLFFSSFHRFY